MEAVGLGGSVADDVPALLAAGRLDGLVYLARGRLETFSEQLEVVDERLHARCQLVLGRRHDLAVVDPPGPVGHAVHGLTRRS